MSLQRSLSSQDPSIIWKMVMIVVSAPSRSCWSGAWQRCESFGGANTHTQHIHAGARRMYGRRQLLPYWCCVLSTCIRFRKIEYHHSSLPRTFALVKEWLLSLHTTSKQDKMQDTDLRSRSSRWWHHNNQPKGVGYQEFHHWSCSTRTVSPAARPTTSMSKMVAAQLRENLLISKVLV